jgi:hypothetical protein
LKVTAEKPMECSLPLDGADRGSAAPFPQMGLTGYNGGLPTR